MKLLTVNTVTFSSFVQEMALIVAQRSGKKMVTSLGKIVTALITN